MDVSIKYSPVQNYNVQAFALQKEIIVSFPGEKFDFKMSEGENGQFTVKIDEEVLFDKKAADRWPVFREIPERVTEYLTKIRKKDKNGLVKG